MNRIIIKIGLYSIVIYILSAVGGFESVTVKSAMILGAILASVNTLIRPVLVLIALPFNIFTFGIASIFANLLSLIIANAIAGGILIGFWWMLLFSLVIMLIDDGVRESRHCSKSNRVKNTMEA